MEIGIIGLGLIGGSLAKSFKKNIECEIIAFDMDEYFLKSAMKEKTIDKSTMTIDESFKDCEIIFICTPINTIVNFIEKLKPHIKNDCIITDVGSTKFKICNETEKVKDVIFIGGHPMTGSEKRGYDASNDYLFENAYYILAKNKNAVSNDKFNFLKDLIQKIGAIPIELNPETHDYIVASISHVPHIVAAALVNSVFKANGDDEKVNLLAAGGFKDITRIASANPDLWSGICVDNKKDIIKILEIFKSEIEDFEKFLKEYDDVHDFFKNAKDYRDSFTTTNKIGYFSNYEIKVDIIDKPGSIATIATLLSVNNINIKNIGIINNREFQDGVMSITFDNIEDVTNSCKLLEGMNYKIY